MSKRGHPDNTDDDAEHPDIFKHLWKKGRHESLADLKSLVNESERSDVILRCSDGEPVYACRVLLAKRCAVFDSMLNNGMMESNLREIRLESSPSRVMLPVIEFLYTGTIDSYPIQDWKMGLELIKAAQFFMITTLKLIAEEYVESEASKACLNGQQNVLMHMLSVSLEFDENWAEKEEMVTKLSRGIHEDWFGLCSTCELSRDAVDYILNKSRGTLDNLTPPDNLISHDEEEDNWPRMEAYCVLRNIILWHVQQVTEADKMEKLKTEILPSRESLFTEPVGMTAIKAFLSESPVSMDSIDSTAVLNSILGVNICKESMEQMLQQYVRLSCIPASLLLVVIHPLKVFPPQELFAALLHVALSKRVDRSIFKSDWWRSPGSTITIKTDGYLSWKSEKIIHTDTAVAQVPAQGYREYGWSFTVFEHDAIAIDVGFICAPRGNYDLVNDIVKKSVRDFSETRFLRINTVQKELSIPREEPKTDWGNWEHYKTTADNVFGFKVEFHFTTYMSRCDAYVGDSREKYSFVNLPGEQYLPVICLNCCLSGLVQLKLLHGFNVY